MTPHPQLLADAMRRGLVQPDAGVLARNPAPAREPLREPLREAQPLFFTIVPVEDGGLEFVDVFIWCESGGRSQPVKLHWYCEATHDLALERIGRLLSANRKETDY